MYELLITIGRITYNFGLFETEFIDQAKADLQKHFPDGKVFAIEKEFNVLRLDDDNNEVIEYFI